MSQECRRVIKQDGIYIFSVIAIPEGLSAADYKLGLEYGPPDVEVEDGYPTMLKKAGWNVIERIDLTEAYTGTIHKMLAEEEAHFDELAELQGKEAVEARIARRALRVKALEMGVVGREQYVARPA